MAANPTASFADLYRSAFAETDLRTKQLLLQQVQRLIDAWLSEQEGMVLGASNELPGRSRPSID